MNYYNITLSIINELQIYYTSITIMIEALHATRN